MAELVGAFAASHGPMIARAWDSLAAPTREPLGAAFDEMGRRLAARRPDVLVIVSADHWVNFFLDNLPSVCIGLGEEHDGPPEPFMRAVFPHETLAGHAGLGRHLVDAALEAGFDPALSYRLRLDHGFCLPLWRMGLDPIPAIVPIMVNVLEPPMPSLRRCLDWGRLVGAAIASYPEPLRVAVLASGGLSHSIGEPDMGLIDEPFDRACIELFGGASDERLAATLEEWLPRTGNGGQEVRCWAVAHAAAGGRGFDLIGYAPLPEVYVGCAFAEWRRAA